MSTAPTIAALALGFAAALAACGRAHDGGAASEPPPDPPYAPPADRCDAASLDDATRMPECNAGGGVFGAWSVDDRGLPAYDYGLDENADARAAFDNTRNLDRRDHWSAFGNGRVTALAANDGYVEVTTQDRGPTYLDKYDEAQGHYGGGIGWLDDGERTWSTAYKWRPRGSTTTRRFGADDVEYETIYRDVRAVRKIVAPPGDRPFVVADVTLENTGTATKTLRHYEYWSVARRQIRTTWVVTGIFLGGQADRERDALDATFDEAVSFDPASGLLGMRRTRRADAPPAAPKEARSAIDDYPGDPFLAVLAGPVSDTFTDAAAFFGEGGPAAPAAVVERRAGEGVGSGPRGDARSGDGEPRAFVVRSDVALAPGEKKTLRFAYGYTSMGDAFPVDERLRDPAVDLRAESAAALRPHLMYFASERDPVLHRELAWHAAKLETSVAWREYWGVHVVPQGSAYLWLHGADGAARDLALFATPLVYTHAALARDELTMMMGVQRASDHAFAYAFQGHGVIDDALGLHAKPSDQDVFFLLALGEYLGATGDWAFLDRTAPFWPKEAQPAATVRDHLVAAVRHLFDVVGTGEHGLVSLGDGDWSDGIVFSAPDRDTAIAKGESVPNTAMASYVLPRVADLMASSDPALAGEIRTWVTARRDALRVAYNGTFFGRAYFGDGQLYERDAIDLEAQVWPLVDEGVLSDDERARLVAAVGEKLDDPNPTGATLQAGGAVWPAISGLLTWGYARSDPARAWAHLARNTLYAHARAFPSIWYGIWTAPDGLQGAAGDKPGESWRSPVTPMLDFPAQNANADAMPLLAALRVAGVEATADGLRVQAQTPGGKLALRTELVDVDQAQDSVRGAYRPALSGAAASRTIHVSAPPGAHVSSATVGGRAVDVADGARTADLPFGGAAPFEVRFAR